MGLLGDSMRLDLVWPFPRTIQDVVGRRIRCYVAVVQGLGSLLLWRFYPAMLTRPTIQGSQRSAGYFQPSAPIGSRYRRSTILVELLLGLTCRCGS